jgi:hypothetical protein
MRKRKTSKKCRHSTVTIAWHPETGAELSRRCSVAFGCGAQLRMGPSNDEPDRVAEGIRAAERLAESAEYITNVAPPGMNESDVWTDDDSFTFSSGPHSDEYIATLWPWDVTRPVAGQYEEWLDDEARRAAPLGQRGHAARCMSADGSTGACDCGGDSEDEMIEAEFAARAPSPAAPVEFAKPPIREVVNTFADWSEDADDAPPIVDPKLATLAEGYLASDEGRAETARRTIAEQTRHDVAASVARHAEMAGGNDPESPGGSHGGAR